MDVKQMDATFIAHTYKRQPIVIASAKGSIAYDDHKKHYIDFTSGIGVNVLGYGYEEWAGADAQSLFQPLLSKTIRKNRTNAL